MTKDIESIYIVEHTLELRHEASGKFLDVRGMIADNIKKDDIFPHWNITDNAISFFDSPKGINQTGAVVSYNKIAFLSYDPSTERYFQDKALKFLKNIQNNKSYYIPSIERFGVRTKCFIPSKLSFSEINKKTCAAFFNETTTQTLGADPNDLQLVFDIKEKEFKVRIIIGPIREKEADRYFSFSAKNKEFEDGGIYIDMDYFKDKKIVNEEINSLLSKSMELTWPKIERIKNVIGI